MISLDSQERWTRYLAAERQAVRPKSLALLDACISSLLLEPSDERHTWALGLAESAADRGVSLPVRIPFFQRILLPELISGVLAREAGCARWLAHFGQQLLQSASLLSLLPPTLRSTPGLLLEALRVAPSDSRARAALVAHQAQYLQYTLHELPVGVLYSTNGASPDECLELLELLSDFRGHLEVLGETFRYASLINECAFHFPAYRQYLLAGSPGHSYQRFAASLHQSGA